MFDSKTNILDYIKKYCRTNPIPMHMPGHKRNTALAPYLKKLGGEYDLTEISCTDDLHCPTGIIANAQTRSANLWKSKNSYFLVNGSTCGILAGVRCAVHCNDTVLIARNCHKSIYNAIELCNLNPVFVTPPTDKSFNIYGSVLPKDILSALNRNKNIKLVILTSPTYEGVISNISEIVNYAHSFGIPVMVDEAHGAHLNFSSHFTGGGISGGADIVIQSLHKTLPSLTQTAIAHINGTLISNTEFSRQLAIFETSSPSYLFMASIDECTSLIKNKGNTLFENWNNNLNLFSDKIKNLNNLKILMYGADNKNSHSAIYNFDKSKIVISTADTNITGVKLLHILKKKYNIELEMAYNSYALAMTGLLEKKGNLFALADALCEIDKTLTYSNNTQLVIPPLAKRNCSVHCALNSPKKSVNLHMAKDKTIAEYIWAYPPGVPIIIPGETISLPLICAIDSLAESGVNIKSTYNKFPNIMVVK